MANLIRLWGSQFSPTLMDKRFFDKNKKENEDENEKIFCNKRWTRDEDICVHSSFHLTLPRLASFYPVLVIFY